MLGPRCRLGWAAGVMPAGKRMHHAGAEALTVFAGKPPPPPKIKVVLMAGTQQISMDKMRTKWTSSQLQSPLERESLHSE